MEDGEINSTDSDKAGSGSGNEFVWPKSFLIRLLFSQNALKSGNLSCDRGRNYFDALD